jgi:predicted Zn-dependent protease with MMP-like domain
VIRGHSFFICDYLCKCLLTNKTNYLRISANKLHMQITREEFEKIVAETIDNLSEKFRDKLYNVAIFVEDFPSAEQKKKMKLRSDYALLGLFEGYAQARRLNFGPVLPDRITIFRQPIMQSCSTKEGCRQQIESTVKHEIAHHFGLDEKGARKASRRRS